MKQHRDNEYVICFLKGFNDSYNTVKTQILLLDPLPSINKVFALVTQQERKILDVNTGDSNPIAAANFSNSWSQTGRNPGSQGRSNTNNQGGRGRGRTNTKQHTFCGRQYHTVESCFFKHGFPPGYRPKNTTNSTAAVTTNSTDNTNSMVEQNKNPVQLSPEDYQNLMNLLHQSKNETSTSKNQLNSVDNKVSPRAPFTENDWGC